MGVLMRADGLSAKDLLKMNNVSSPVDTIDDGIFPGDGLIEFLSRPARKRIVESLCGALLRELREEGNTGVGRKRRGRPFSSGSTLLASRLGLSRQSVNRWLSNVMQSSNTNAAKIVELARELIPETLEEVLYRDVDRHRAEVERLLKSHGGAPLSHARETSP